MTFQSALESLGDPANRLSSAQLVSLSALDDEDLARLAEVWPTIHDERRRSLLGELADLAQDNIELNFDAVFKAALQDEEGTVRSAAIRGLVEYESSDLITTLGTMLREDTDAGVRREAAVALGRYALLGELGHIGETARAQVRELLIESAEDTEEDNQVRARAVEALGAIGDEETENLIESIYNEESLYLKIGAVDAMGRSCNEAWLPLVIQEMESRAPVMRHAAAFAAGEIADEEAVAPLQRLAIGDSDREVRLAAVHALGEIGGQKASVALKAVLYEGHDDLREAIEEALNEASFNDDPLRLI